MAATNPTSPLRISCFANLYHRCYRSLLRDTALWRGVRVHHRRGGTVRGGFARTQTAGGCPATGTCFAHITACEHDAAGASPHLGQGCAIDTAGEGECARLSAPRAPRLPPRRALTAPLPAINISTRQGSGGTVVAGH